VTDQEQFPEIFQPPTPQGFFKWSGFTKWAREKIAAAAQPGPEWVDIGGGEWARPVVLDRELVIVWPPQGSPTFKMNAKIVTGDFDNGRKWAEAIEKTLVEEVGCGITKLRSCFLNYKADGTQPATPEYAAAALWGNVLMFQTSDITRSTAAENASRAVLKVDEMFAIFRVLHLRWRIETDGADTVFRLEHDSYFEGAAAFDLAPFFESWQGARELDLAASVADKYERFTTQDNDEGRIEYLTACAEPTETATLFRLLSVRLGYMANNADANDDGIFLMACSQVGEIFTPINGNEPMRQRAVLPTLGRRQRSYQIWQVNGAAPDVVSLSVRKRSKTPNVQIKMSHLGAAGFAPNGPTAGFWNGAGEIQDASYSLKKQRLTLEITT
jgi:hypothetical protein